MRILPQIASFSYSSSPGVLLLPAPKIAGLLPAPKIAGLLTAPQPKITVEKIVPERESRVFRSFAEWQAADEEIAAFLEGMYRRLAAAHPEV
jgi:hypothetical protein